MTNGRVPGGGPDQKRRRTGGRSARVREAVLEAALEVLLESGLGGFRVPEVAERAGVHKTTIYRRWGDGANLLLDVLLSRVGTQIKIPDTGSLKGDLAELLREVAAFLEGPFGALTRAWVSSVNSSADFSAVRRKYWARRFALNAQIFERAIERGELPPGTAPHLALEALIGPLYLRVLVTGEPLDDAFLEGVVSVALDGLARAPDRADG